MGFGIDNGAVPDGFGGGLSRFFFNGGYSAGVCDDGDSCLGV